MQVCQYVTLVVAVLVSVIPGRRAIQGFFLQGLSQKELVDYLWYLCYIVSPEVKQAMLQVDRKNFAREMPYLDRPVNIGCNATVSQPFMHAIGLELLKDHLKPGIKALDVGSGSGYMTACMALMAGNTSRVIGVEHIQELVDLAKSNLMKDKPELLTTGRVKFYLGDGRRGMKEEAPFDVIYAGASISKKPQELMDQLKAGGRLVIPIGPPNSPQKLTTLDKDKSGKVSVTSTSDCFLLPLTDRHKQCRQK